MKYLYILLIGLLLSGCGEKPRQCANTVELGGFISQEYMLEGSNKWKVNTDKGTYYIWTNFNGINKGDRVWTQDRRLRADGLCYGVKNQIHLCFEGSNSQCYWTY